MKTLYRGIPNANTMEHEVVVYRDDDDPKPLNPRLDVCNHSPTGLSWGYSGSGPAQLSLALLCDVVGVERAKRIYQRFKFSYIAVLPQKSGWVLTEDNIRVMAEAVEADLKQSEAS